MRWNKQHKLPLSSGGNKHHAQTISIIISGRHEHSSDPSTREKDWCHGNRFLGS